MLHAAPCNPNGLARTRAEIDSLFVALTLLILATLAGMLLRRRTRRPRPPLADQIDAVLPQTQCTQCGYRGCRPYAEAIARGDADINQCPPGGAAGVRALARVKRIKPKPHNPAHGPDKAEPTLAQPSAVHAAIERARAMRAVRSPLATAAPRPEDDSAHG